MTWEKGSFFVLGKIESFKLGLNIQSKMYVLAVSFQIESRCARKSKNLAPGPCLNAVRSSGNRREATGEHESV